MNTPVPTRRSAALGVAALAVAVLLPLIPQSAASAATTRPVCPQTSAMKGAPIESSRAMAEHDTHVEAAIVAGALPPGIALTGSMAELTPYAFEGTPTSEGSYSFTLRLTFPDAHRESAACTMTVTKQPSTVRIEGADRYDQAALVSSSTFSTAETVYLASGEKFPDALSAGSVAGIHGAPLLLTAAADLPAATKTELARLRPNDIVVVGGPSSVSAAVVDGLARDFPGTKVTRIAGADRYAASRALIQHPVFGATSAPWIYLATGTSFPDALAASPAAISVNAPVLLIDGSQPAPNAAETALLKAVKVTGIRIAGGPSSVGTAMESALKAGPWAVTRVSGIDRYTGAVALNQVFDASSTVFFASGDVFSDALSGAPAAGHQSAPVYLVRKDCVPVQVLRDVARLRATRVVVLGGSSTLATSIDRLKACI